MTYGRCEVRSGRIGGQRGFALPQHTPSLKLSNYVTHAFAPKVTGGESLHWVTSTKGQVDKRFMSFQEKINRARLNALDAEEALDAFIRAGRFDRLKFQKLADAARIARDELLDQLSELWPAELPHR